MCIKHQIARDTIHNVVATGSEFTYKEVVRKIIESGGILRTSVGTTVGNYLEFLEDKGVIHYSLQRKTFTVLKKED